MSSLNRISARVKFVLMSLFVRACCCMEKSAEDANPPKYGVDVSMPIHRRVSYNYPTMPHNTAPEKFQTPPVFKDMPLQILGDRQKVYNEYLSGCRKHYHLDHQQCDLYEYDRMLMSLRQPQSMQNYTAKGFMKVDAPPYLKRLIEDFWNKNQQGQVQENWPKGNTYTNHWASPTYMVSVDDKRLRGSGAKLKEEAWAALSDLLEDWVGEELSPTSMYGIRVYTDGAMVLPHVDRLPLVASAMLNVAQDVDEDWPIEMYDHDGVAHNITLSPGEMVLWESHSILHGRPFAMKGKMYAMLFIHFEPTGHSLRHGAESSVVKDVHAQYKAAAAEGVGGQSASDRGLPPYIIRESPEESHWRASHPNGWIEPTFFPRSRQHASVLHQAAAKGDVQRIEKAIEESENSKEILDMRDDEGWQLIHEGTAHGHTDVVTLLVSSGADINARTHGGRGGSPLYVAEKNHPRNHPLVKYLKSLGALSLGPDL
mmetsp:Transcript_22113/g.46546  ORF Transcript_22113/g.46546 Transcript_22113/m.46546 type:complete len:483 (-) Transcript_22113:78-1526(-)|eukprot:CAMPEP_0171330166 /NCGR_PEP_ID=MMETSP0878-20121228/1808_1 /TAXON_ID=67004 /ORGANISM="Thalassiosira weissflogii, Strain CCMP1336" /LENGTH=482 /DNA_ID=CAMNT_0011830387 /DNA_START=84 /DNA_END=1532 /DNA_ORIENTATION=-